MSGLIQRELYDAVVRERDDLLEQVEYLRALIPSDTDAVLIQIYTKLGMRRAVARLFLGLARVFPRPLSRCQLVEFCSDETGTKVVDVHLTWMRKAIRANGGPQEPVQNMHGVGWRLTPETMEWLQAAVPGVLRGTQHGRAA